MKVAIFLIPILLLCHLPLMGQTDKAIYPEAVLTIVNDVKIAAESAGIVEVINIRPGQDIAIGAPLVQLNKRSFQSEYSLAIAELEMAKLAASNNINIEYAHKLTAVNKKLLQRSTNARRAYQKSISQTEIDRLELEYQKSQLSVQQAEIEKETASKNLDTKQQQLSLAAIRLKQRSVLSPISGRLEQLFVQKGQWVDAGEPIARIIDLKKLRIKAIFSKEIFPQIRNGCGASFRYRLGARDFEIRGRVNFVSSEIRNDDSFQVWVDVDNDRLLLAPGVTGELTIELLDLESPQPSK